MVKTESKIPELRFPEFEGEWQMFRLKDFILKLEAGVSVNSDDTPCLKGEFGILKTSAVSQGRFYPQQNKTILEKDLNRASLNPKKDSIIISRMNTPELVGESGYVDKNYTNLFVPDRLWMTTTNKRVCVKWLSYALITPRLRFNISSIGTGTSGSMKNIAKPNFLNLLISYASLEEQQKIATFLTAVDNKIQQLTQKKALLQDYKKGVMQQLFSQQIRFKPDLSEVEGADDGSDFPEWEEKRLGELACNIKAGKDKNDDTGGYVLYGSTGIIGTSAHGSYSGTFILVARVGANAGLISMVKGNFGVTDNTLCLDISNEVDCKFVYYMLLKFNLNRLVFGSGQPLITGGQLKSLKVRVPCLEEQQKIADFLTAIDTKIEQVNTQLEQSKVFKKGLLQKMFV